MFQIRSFFWSVFSPNTGKYGPEKTSYLDTFHAGIIEISNTGKKNSKLLYCFVNVADYKQ